MQHNNYSIKHEKLQLDIKIGKNIQNFRLNHFYSIEQFAESIGLSVSHLHLIENGERSITPFVMSRLAREFNISIDNLVFDYI